MSESIDTEQADRVLKVLADSLEQGKDFVMEQAPDVVQQFIAWKRAELSVYCALAGLMLLVVVPFAWRCCAQVRLIKADGTWRMEDTKAIVYAASAAVCAVIGTAVLCNHLSPLLQVWIAPKVYLLEYVARLAT